MASHQHTRDHTQTHVDALTDKVLHMKDVMHLLRKDKKRISSTTFKKRICKTNKTQTFFLLKEALSEQ